MKYAIRSLVHAFVLSVMIFAAASAGRAQQPAGSISLAEFGTAGQGGDDTAVLQAAIDATARSGQTLFIPASPSPYTVGPLWLRDGTSITLDSNAVVQARAGYIDTGDPVTSDKMINIRDVSNVRIEGNGAIFRMPKAEYTRGEYRHCLDIRGATNVRVTRIQCNDSGGDGLYIGEGAQGYSRNITVEDSSFNNNRRQGFSLISGAGVYIRRCRFTNTIGTDPQAGIDIEPNQPSDRLSDVHIEDSVSEGNAGDGVKFSTWFMTGTPNPVDITVLRHQSTGNKENGYEAVCQYGVGGQILVESSSSAKDALYGAVGDQAASCPAVVFNYLTVTDPNQARRTRNNAAVGVNAESASSGTAGNVHFLLPAITDTSGSIDYYFSFGDAANAALDKVHFLNPVELSGATYHPYGLLAGAKATAVDIGAVPTATCRLRRSPNPGRHVECADRALDVFAAERR